MRVLLLLAARAFVTEVARPKDRLLHALLAPPARERMDGPREVRAVKVALILRAFMKRRNVLDPPRVSAGVVRPGSL